VRRASIVLRSRFAEDRLAAAAARGAKQYVIVAAGLDTFPWRQPGFAREMRVFVTDLPESLAVLQDCVRRRGLPQPANLAYVPLDLEHKALLAPLVAAGFDPGLPTFCSALGILQFLTLDAVDALLAFAARCAKGSEIVFSFTPPDDELDERARRGVHESQVRTQGYGEPWLTRLRPSQLTARLSLLGYSDIEQLTPDLADERYFRGRTDGLASASSGQVMAATV
jgi:methyltransferase (TIGR00027 family)